MKLFNRDSIARDIEYKIFNGKDVWSLVFTDVKEGIHFVASGTSMTRRRMFEKMEYNVRRKANILGGKLRHIYVILESGRRREMNYRNAEDLMSKVMDKQLNVVFKIMVRNKYYEYTVGH